MSSRHSRLPVRALAALTGGALVAAGLTLTPAVANPAGTGLVISEVYGGGGNTGATFTHDFVELYNPTASDVSVAGWSVQYRSATGTTATVTSLSGTVPAHGHYLVQQASTANVGAPLPTPDATGTTTMSGTNGVVLLVAGTTAVTTQGDLAGSTAVVDAVGYGTTPTTYETVNTGVALTNATSASRAADGADTDHNANDFGEGTPVPENSGDVTPPPPAGDKTIAEIQGTTGTSPLAGQTVTTTGRVTASYPTGGFRGFYLQTGGADVTPDASDGIFVFTPALAADAYPAVGASLKVTGTVSEFSGLTEISVAPADIQIVADLPAVVPLTEVPGTTCALPGDACLTGAALDAAREKHEGELVQPTGDYTVTDTYDGSAYNGGGFSSSMFGEIGLAAESDLPLVAPTELYDDADPAVDQRKAWNDAHRVILDDGSSLNYTTAANTASPFPYYTADHVVRVGAGVTFDQPFVLDYRFGWKAQPQHQVVGEPTGLVTFEQTREAAPQDVGGDVQLATFNVLNYFTTLGDQVAGCTPYYDRADDPVTVRSCSVDNGPRGAWEAEDLARQQVKIVNAINALDADVVSLEEIENSRVVDGVDRDEALAALVDALNADAGTTRWAFVDSPGEAGLPPVADEDVIRTGFIYDPSTVELVGEARILVGSAAFENAREPLAQAFKAAGTRDADAFAVVANHFKSKGSGVDDGTGQGNANPDRVAQAHALVDFADAFAADAGTDKVFLTGDFNAYSHEDPVQVIEEEGGYTNLESTSDAGEESYNFDGQVGSLDHVFANEAALADVTGVDVWTINAYESVYYEYSRHNYNVTDLYSPGPFRSSDHNPEIVGIDTPAPPVATSVSGTAATVGYGSPATVEVQVTSPVATTGTVTLLDGTETIATGSVAPDGTATLTVPAAALDLGTNTFVLAYSGDDANLASSGSVTVEVVKATPTVSTTVDPTRVTTKSQVSLTVGVTAPGQTVTGDVTVTVDGETWTQTLSGGSATFDLGRFKKQGDYPVTVQYLGNQTTEAATESFTLVVHKK